MNAPTTTVMEPPAMAVAPALDIAPRPPVPPGRTAAPAGLAFSGVVRRVVDGLDLSEADMAGAVEALMGGDVPPAQAACFLTALRMKGETVEEIVGAARAMRDRATAVAAPDTPNLVDTCGTGGDGAETFNISTTTAFVLAGAGVRVAKHGNRAVSSSCGSADVLESLGVRLDLSADAVGRCVEDVGIGFLFAPALHSAMRHVATVRQDLGIRTIFNLLGPLTNPAGAERQVLGVYRADLAPVLANALGRLGSRRAMVVHGCDGLDEISISGPTVVAEWDGAAVREYRIHPEQVGLTAAPLDSLRGGDVRENARLLRGVLAGEPGPRRNVVLLNAAAALMVAGAADDLPSGMALAMQSIDSGRALAKLVALVGATRNAMVDADEISTGTGGRAAALGIAR